MVLLEDKLERKSERVNDDETERNLTLEEEHHDNLWRLQNMKENPVHTY